MQTSSRESRVKRSTKVQAVRVKRDLLRACRAAAADRGIPFNAWAVEAFSTHLGARQLWLDLGDASEDRGPDEQAVQVEGVQ